MDWIKLTGDQGTVAEGGGGEGGNPYTWDAPKGCHMIGTSGNIDWVMSNFSIIYICEDDYAPTTTVLVGTPGSRSAGSAAGEAAVSSWSHNDEVSGVILHLYDATTNPAATVYSGSDCTGHSAALFTDNLQPKSYNQ